MKLLGLHQHAFINKARDDINRCVAIGFCPSGAIGDFDTFYDWKVQIQDDGRKALVFDMPRRIEAIPGCDRGNA